TMAGLTLWKAHRRRLAEETTTELRRIGVHAKETYVTDPRWLRFARAVGLSSATSLFERTTYKVRIEDNHDAAEALRLAARLPGLVELRVLNAPNFDDNALAAVGDCTELRGIGFSKTGVTDAGLRHLQHCGRLQWAAFDECPVTDEGIRLLCGLPGITLVR